MARATALAPVGIRCCPGLMGANNFSLIPVLMLRQPDKSGMVSTPPGDLSPVNGFDPETRSRYMSITNWGTVTGIFLYGALLLFAFLFNIPGFSGAWMGFCAINYGGLITISGFFLMIGGGPAVVYFYASRNDAEIKSNSRIRYHLFNGIFAMCGSYFLVFLLSIILQILMPFPPEEAVWIFIQCGLFMAGLLGIKWYNSRSFGVPMRWLPSKMQILFVIGIIGLIQVFMFLMVYLEPVFSIISGHG